MRTKEAKKQTGEQRFRAESGQSLLEVALLSPLLILLLLGTIDMGRYGYQSIQLGNAARAGVAWGARDPLSASDPNKGIEVAACNDYTGSSPCGLTSTTTHTFVCECDNAGTMSTIDCKTGTCATTDQEVTSLSVTVTDSFNPLFTWRGIPTISLTKTAIMRIANPS